MTLRCTLYCDLRAPSETLKIFSGPRSNFEIGGGGGGTVSDSILGEEHKTPFLTNRLYNSKNITCPPLPPHAPGSLILDNVSRFSVKDELYGNPKM